MAPVRIAFGDRRVCEFKRLVKPWSAPDKGQNQDQVIFHSFKKVGRVWCKKQGLGVAYASCFVYVRAAYAEQGCKHLKKYLIKR